MIQLDEIPKIHLLIITTKTIIVYKNLVISRSKFLREFSTLINTQPLKHVTQFP